MIDREKLVSMVLAVQRQEDAAVAELYDTFYDSIYYHILKNVNNDAELAADLTQDTFVEILETIHKLQEPAAFVTWSQQIAFHRCTAYFRKRKELLVDEYEDGYSVFDTQEEVREEFIPDEALDKEDLKQTIQNMINDLPEEQRSALILRYFNEISVKEIAQIQGVSEGTVKSRLNYARKSIKLSVETYEKKNDIKLHCAGVIPMLLWFFRMYRVSNGLSVAGATASAVFATASATEAATATAATTSAVTTTTSATKAGVMAGVKVAGKTAAAKVIAGVTAAMIAAGCVAVGVGLLDKGDLEYTPINNGNVLEVSGIGDFTGTEIVIPTEVDGKIVVGIADYAFEECTEIISIDIPDTVTSIGDYAFYRCENVTEINLPNGLEIIEEGTFSHCRSLKNIIIPDNIRKTNEKAFSYCESITDIIIPYGITRIERDTFRGCKNLQNLILPESVKFIGTSAYSNCDSLTEVIIPGHVTELEHGVFASCSNLRSIYFLEGLQKIGHSTFSSCTSLEKVCFPASLVDINVFQFEKCSKVNEIVIAEGNPRYHSAGNCIIETYTKTLCGGCINSVIPNDGSVQIIGGVAFSGVFTEHMGNEISIDEMVDFNFPEGVISIEYGVFDICDRIRSISLPLSVEYIDEVAFRGCDNLTDVYYVGTMEQFSRIRGIDWSSDKYYESIVPEGIPNAAGSVYRSMDVPFTCTIHCTDGSFSNR